MATKSSVIKNAEKAFKYSVKPVIEDRTPFMTGTVQSAVSAAKDLREWTIRNNPFRPVNGNKDPLVRQIANVAIRSVKDAKRDLMAGDLTFRRLNKTLMDFVGGGEEQFDFDLSANFDFDFGGGDSDFSFEGNDDSSSSSSAAIAGALSQDFAQSQMHATSAMIGAVEHATNKMTHAQMVVSESAVTRLISNNMTIAARTSSQLSGISSGIEAVNNNLSLLVQQGNDIAGFVNQSQRYMQNTEQSLNDIKALLQAMNPETKKRDHSAKRDLPDFMDGHFDVKKYIHYIFNDSSASFMLSSALGTAFKALKLELPSFIDEMYAQPLQELNPIKKVVERLFPAVDRLGNLDKVINRTFESFMARMNAGEYQGILQNAGLFDFGFERARKRNYSSSAYDKGTVSWNGKSERALQEVIPEYLSSMESYLEIIAKNTSKDGNLDRSNRRLYDYDEGKFFTKTEINRRAIEEMTYVVQSAFGETTSALEKVLKDSDNARQDMTDLLQKIMSNENMKYQAKDEWYQDLYNIISRNKAGPVREAEVRRIYETILSNRRDAILNMNELKSAAGARDNFMYLAGDRINEINPEIIYASKGVLEEKQYAHMTEEQRRKHDQDKKNEELKKGFMGKLKSTGVGKTLSNFIDDYKKKGGAINRMIDYGNDALTMLLTGLVHNIPSYDVGTSQVPHDQVAQVHKDEIIIPKAIADKIRAGQFSDKAVERWLTEVSGITPEAKNMQGTLAQLQSALGTVAGVPSNGDMKMKAQGAILDSSKEYYRLAINADAIKNGDVRQMLAAILENSANQTAMMAHNFEGEESDQRVENTNDMIAKALGTKGEDGLYHGTALSQYANMGLDLKNAIKHALYGEEYTTSQGVKVAKDEDNVFSIIGNTTKKIGDTALTAIFGENYKDSKQFKALAKAHDDVKAGLTASAKGTQYEGAFVEGTYDEDHAPKSSGQTVVTPQMYKEARVRANMSSKEAASRIGTNYQTLNAFEAGKNTKLTDEQLSILRQVLGLNIEETTPEENERAINAALQETSEKSLELNKKFIGTTKGALLGGIGFTAVGALGGTGIIPTLLTPGGPIGGAILGATVSILSRNEGFMNMLFGEKDENGERVGGAISKEMQERWKGLGAKLLGPAVIGAAGGFLFPTLTKVATGGWLGSALIGGGPILGATLGIGTSLILRSKAVQDVLYGEEGKGGTTGIIGQAKTAAKQFWAKNKGQAKGLGLGALGGGLLGLAGGSALGLPGLGIGGLVIGTSLLGATMGIKAGSDKFNEFLFGTRKYETDKDGKKVFVGRDGDGFIGKMGRMISVNVLHPIERFAKSASDSFAEWIRYDIGYQIKSIFEPFTKSLENAVNYAADGFKSLGKKIFGVIAKLTKPFRVIAGSILKLAGRAAKGTLQTGLGIAGSVISAPLKVAGHFGRKLSGKLDPEIDMHNKQFWKGHALNMISPIAIGKNAISAFSNSKGNFFDALGDGARALNPFMAYGDARIKYAEEHGLTDSAAFMGGWLGGAGKEHRDIVRENRRKARNEKKLEALRKEWATKDNYNDKIMLDPKELKKRNKALAKIMGPGYENKSNEELIDYIYDPFGHKKKEKDEATEVVNSINTYVSDISSVLHNILDYVSGAKVPSSSPTSSSPSSAQSNASNSYADIKAKYDNGEITKEEFDDQADELAINQLNEMLLNGEISQEEYDARMAELHIADNPPTKTFGERMRDFGNNTKVGRFFKAGFQKAGAFKSKVRKGYNNMINDLKDARKKKDNQEKESDPMDLMSEHELSEAAYARRNAERNGEATTAADQPIEADEGPIEVALEDEQVEKMGFGSIFSKEGLLGSIGTIAVVGGVGFLLTKFPTLIEKIPELIGNIKTWWTDTAWPWLTDTAWPIVKSFVGTVGSAILKISDAVASEGESWFFEDSTGKYYSASEREKMNTTARNMSGATTDVLMTELNNSSVLSKIIGIDNFDITDKDAALAVILKEGVLATIENGGTPVPYSVAYERVMAMDSDKAKMYYNTIAALSTQTAAGNMVTPHSTSVKHVKLYMDTFVDENLQSRYNAYINGAIGHLYRDQDTAKVQDTSIGSGHFMQNDSRWGNILYSSTNTGKYSTMSNGGCGPTALANIAVQNGIRTNPLAVARIAQRNGYTANGGTTAGLFTRGVNKLGLHSSPIGVGSFRKSIANGRSVLFAGKGNGIYTKAGHIMSASGLDNHGRVIVNDPMRRNPIAVPMSTIGKGMTHAWSIGRGDEETVNTDTAAQQYANSMREMTDKDTIHSALEAPYEKTRYYYQLDPKWSEKPLVYFANDYIGDSGCVISSLGSVLATITGLNFRPDFITEKIIGTSGVQNVLKIYEKMLPPSVSSIYTPVRLQLGDRWDKYTSGRYTNSGQTDKVVIITSPGAPYPGYYDSGSGQLVQAPIIENGKQIGNINQYTSSDGSSVNFENLESANKYGKMFTQGLNAPFVIYGGFNYANGGSPMVWTRGANTYSQHAKLVVPSNEGNDGRYSGANIDATKRMFYVYDVGSKHLSNTQYVPYSELFGDKGGVESVFMLVPKSGNRTMTNPTAYGIPSEPSEEDIQWMIDKFDPSINPHANTTTTIQNILDGTESRAIYGEAITDADSNSGNNTNILSIISEALSKLGDIALNALGSLFGGKYKTPDSLSYYMNRDYGDAVTATSNATNTITYDAIDVENRTFTTAKGRTINVDGWSGYELWKLLDKKEITKDEYDVIIAMKGLSNKPTTSGTGKNSAQILAKLRSSSIYKDYYIPAYSSLPPWALESAGESNENDYLPSAPFSSKLNKTDIDNIVAASLTLSAYREGGFNGIANYFSDEKSYVDNDRYPAFGIDGFNGNYGHAQEVLRRMINSGSLAPEDVAIAEDLIAQCGIRHYKSNPFDAAKLKELLNKYPEISKYAQAGYATQLMYSSTADVIRGYENGDLRTIEEMILMNHLSPYGPTFVEAMLGLNPGGSYSKSGEETLDKIRKLSFSKDSFTNLAKAINDFHAVVRPSNNNGKTTWGSWHQETLREAYRAMGGTESVGFGGGIADSYRTDSYDIVDTPFAINKTPRVEVDVVPVTNRLDVIISYLKQIAIGARNAAGTAATNLDIGYGLKENQKLSNAGIQRKENIPIYTENNQSDKLKQIHDRIARSPRPV